MDKLESKKVSIIMAVYNGGEYLNLCLQSLKNQTYKNFEVIMINDGSKDDSGSICDYYAKIDDRFIVYHQENAGCSKARNFGLSKATGEYIGIVDQDDYLHKDYISYFMSVINQYNVDIVTTKHIKNFIGNPPVSTTIINKNIELWSGDKTAKEMLLYTLQVGPWNKLIRRELIQKNGIKFLENLYCGEGFAFSVECFQSTERVAVSDASLYFYRIDNATSGTSSFSIKKYNSSLIAQDYMREKLLDKSKYADKILKYSKWKTISDYYILINISGAYNNYQECYEEMKKKCRKDAIYCFFLPTNLKQKLRTFLFIVSPTLAVFLLGKRISRETGGKFNKNNKEYI